MCFIYILFLYKYDNKSFMRYKQSIKLVGRQFLNHRMFDFPTGFFFLICKKKLVICDELRTHFFVVFYFLCVKNVSLKGGNGCCAIEQWMGRVRLLHNIIG